MAGARGLLQDEPVLVCRFVLLPLEAHGYQGRESVLHMLWEMENWLDKYVKPEQPVGARP